VFALLEHNLHKRFVGENGVVVIVEQIYIFETLIIKYYINVKKYK